MEVSGVGPPPSPLERAGEGLGVLLLLLFLGWGTAMAWGRSRGALPPLPSLPALPQMVTPLFCVITFTTIQPWTTGQHLSSLAAPFAGFARCN